MSPPLVAICKEEARRLAADGDDRAALELLELIPAAESAKLRARIHLRQGRFAKSVEDWTAALAADPNDDEARRGLKLARSLERSPFGRLRLHARRLAAVAILIVAIAASAWYATARPRDPTTRELAESMKRLEEQVAELHKSTRGGEQALARVEAAQTAAASKDVFSAEVRRIQRSLRDIRRSLEKR
jgi:tetratricopeptide (TPR) repeat protein